MVLLDDFLQTAYSLVEDTTGKGHKSRVISAAESLAMLVQLKS